jgi:mono/diheme cytochrome c family protein
MKTLPGFPASVLLIGSFVFLFGCQSPPAEESQSAAASPAKVMDPAARGRYLVTTGACNDCHTPFKMGEMGPEPDMTRMLSGHPQDLVLPPVPGLGDGSWMWGGSASMTAFFGPWGVSYSANLTPDVDTGIGAWTEDMFMQSLKTGKHWGTGRQIQPPMPWPWYSQMSDEDLKAIYAYLKTIPAVHNEVPPYQPPTGG